MAILLVELFVSIGIILLSCELFANGVEQVGNKFGMSHAAAGSLLAAVGTAMPETMIPILALVFGKGHVGEEIGIGAILGAPFMLCTLAFFLLGLTMQILNWRGKRNSLTMDVDLKAMTFELKFFVPIIFFVLIVSLIGNRTLNYAAGVVLILLYIFYVKKSLGHEGREEEEYCELFYFGKYLKMPCNGLCITCQLFTGLVGIILGAKIFVGSIAGLSALLGFSPLIILYHFPRDGPLRLTVNPFMDHEKERGVFATRHHDRPNRIGMSIVELLSVEGTTLSIRGVDVINGTPLLDIKPYVFHFDHRDQVRSGWVDLAMRDRPEIPFTPESLHR